MLGFIKKLFGGKTETTVSATEEKESTPTFDSNWPFPAGTAGSGFEEAKPAKKATAKKPAAKKAPAKIKAEPKKAPAKKTTKKSK